MRNRGLMLLVSASLVNFGITFSAHAVVVDKLQCQIQKVFVNPANPKADAQVLQSSQFNTLVARDERLAKFPYHPDGTPGFEFKSSFEGEGTIKEDLIFRVSYFFNESPDGISVKQSACTQLIHCGSYGPGGPTMCSPQVPCQTPQTATVFDNNGNAVFVSNLLTPVFVPGLQKPIQYRASCRLLETLP